MDQMAAAAIEEIGMDFVVAVASKDSTIAVMVTSTGFAAVTRGFVAVIAVASMDSVAAVTASKDFGITTEATTTETASTG